MDQSVCILELLGVLFFVTAWVCSLTTTLMACWLKLNTELLPTESYQVGLWETCVVQELGVLECRPYDTLLGLPPDIRLARILMLTTLSTSLMGFTLVIPGIYVVNSCRATETLKAKRTLKMLGATLCLAAGVLGLVPVSYVAHLTILKFFDESVPDMVPRWELGDALFWGWGASIMHLVAGSLLVTSCLFLQGESCPLPVSIPLQGDPELSPRRRTPTGPPQSRWTAENDRVICCCTVQCWSSSRPSSVDTGRCPTGRCPQDAAPQDAAHRTLPTGRWPTGRCPTRRCPTGHCPTGRCPTRRWPTGPCWLDSLAHFSTACRHPWGPAPASQTPTLLRKAPLFVQRQPVHNAQHRQN
ncbi:hypothetical protein NFI96_002398 [Prochilodus magdalenae]|nr:hypothetical protein NFI96_002398 [Prochilodus magdalenae]